MEDMRQLSEEIKRILRSPYRVGLNVSSLMSLPFPSLPLLFPFPVPKRPMGRSNFAAAKSNHSVSRHESSSSRQDTTKTRKGKSKTHQKEPILFHSRVTPVIRNSSTFSMMPTRIHCRSGLAVIHARLMDLQRSFLMAPNSRLFHWKSSDFCVR